MHVDATKTAYDPASAGRGAAAMTEKAARLPGLNDPYEAAGTAENHEVSRLVLVMGKDGFRPGGTAYHFIQYVHISMGEFGFTANGQVFRFLVADLVPKLVTVEGSGLLRTCDQIALRRCPWIRQADRNFRPPGSQGIDELIITRIDVTPWKRPLSQAEELAQVLEVYDRP